MPKKISPWSLANITMVFIRVGAKPGHQHSDVFPWVSTSRPQPISLIEHQIGHALQRQAFPNVHDVACWKIHQFDGEFSQEDFHLWRNFCHVWLPMLLPRILMDWFWVDKISEKMIIWQCIFKWSKPSKFYTIHFLDFLDFLGSRINQKNGTSIELSIFNKH